MIVLLKIQRRGKRTHKSDLELFFHESTFDKTKSPGTPCFPMPLRADHNKNLKYRFDMQGIDSKLGEFSSEHCAHKGRFCFFLHDVIFTKS